MQNMSRLTALLIASAIIASPVLAADKPAAAGKAGVVATVNGVAISQKLADQMLAEQKAQGAPDNAEIRNAIRNRLITGELLSQEAKRKNLDKRADIAAQLDFARTDVLARAAVEEYVKAHPVSDEQVKKAYEQLKGRVTGNEFKARHILVENESDAKAIIAKIKSGEKLADLAKQSIDPGSKDNGGDLGWSIPGTFVQPFAEALSKLEKGKYTETPVQTQFGWHVIQVDDIRPLTPPSFDEAKPQLKVMEQQALVQQLIKELAGKAKVE